jgi:hypothetical protein
MGVPVEHFVTMPNFPEGLQFPPTYADRIWYDAVTKRLVFRGVMSKVDFDRLNLLCEDWGYRRRLEDLFRLSMPEEPKRAVFARLLSALHLGL